MTEKPRFRVAAGDDVGVSARAVDLPQARKMSATPTVAPLGSGFEAARGSRRLAAWRPTRINVNGLMSASGDLLVARARDQVRNNPYAASAAATFAAYVAGTGIVPSSTAKPSAPAGNAARPAGRTAARHNGGPALDDDATDQQAEINDLFADWTDEADADGLTDFYGLQWLAARALFEAGEVFVRFRPRRPEDDLVVPLQLQLLEAEMLPLTLNRPAAGLNEIRAGIEFDAIGRRVAYHFYRQHPGDTTQAVRSGETVRVPASEVLHLYRFDRPGQIRGVPWITPALLRLFLLDAYDDAELARKQTAALFAGFIYTQNPGGAEEFVAQDPANAADAAGRAPLPLQPGTMQVLDPGEDVKFSEPADVGGAYDPFQYRNLCAIAAALGVPYQSLTNDLKGANYSNTRAGRLDFRRRVEALQHHVFAPQFCRPVWRRWMDAAVLSGALDLEGYAGGPRTDRVRWQRVKWQPPKWEWVDPLKDLQAERLAVRAGFKARDDVIEENGLNPAETDKRVAAGNKRADDLGLVVDSDPRRITNAGLGQSSDPSDVATPINRTDGENQDGEQSDAA